MLGGSMFNDPFFSHHADQMRRMDQMFQAPLFGDRRGGGMLSVGDGREGRRSQQRRQQLDQQLSHRNNMMDPFAHFNSMFSNMRNMMTEMHQAFGEQGSNPNAHVFQQSTFFSSSNMGGGAPKVFQASSSVRQGPGGVKETRKAVRDSETGVERVAMGHHIRDRGHIIERSRNNRTGEKHQNQEFVNLDEEEAPAFDKEFQERSRGMHGALHGLHGVEQRRRRIRDQVQAHNHHNHRAVPRGLPEPEPMFRRPRKASHRRE